MSSGIGIKQDNIREIDIKAVGVVKQDARLVAESIHRILNTRPWERPRERVGCRIKEMLFEPNDYNSGSLGAYYVSTAIEKFEPRVKVEEITPINFKLSPNENLLLVRVIFSLVDDPGTLFGTQARII